MQFEWPFTSERSEGDAGWMPVGAQRVRLRLVRHRRARRYVLRLSPDGSARVTIPRGGSAVEATRFAQRNSAWLERQLLRRAAQVSRPQTWLPGTEILLRGEWVRLETDASGAPGLIRFGSESARLGAEPAASGSAAGPPRDLRSAVERHLRHLAARELPTRVAELAALHQFHVARVSVRNQRSRWGSCSRRGTISLNWRLVQTPPFVRDYLILHELAHLRQMNHSARFWEEVSRLCPDFDAAEGWLKSHPGLLYAAP